MAAQASLYLAWSETLEDTFCRVVAQMESGNYIGKASGSDDIKPVVLKELMNEFSPVILVIFEKSLETDQLPKDGQYQE